MLESFYYYLETLFTWFFGSTILSDPLFSLVSRGLECFLGFWLLYLLIAKPILYIFGIISNKIWSNH